MTIQVTFIGGGNMSTALTTGLLANAPHQYRIHVVDIDVKALNKLQQVAQQCHVSISTSTMVNASITISDVLILAVKPQQMQDMLSHCQPFIRDPLIISVAAGCCQSDLSRWCGGYSRIVRAMPNTPALIQQGMTGLVPFTGMTTDERKLIDQIMQCVGQTLWFDDETLLDAVTAISGSGPAYVFYFIEALQEAAVDLGLSQAQAQTLVLATFSGATQLAQQSNASVIDLRARVTSTGGTTHAALLHLEEKGVKTAIIAAAKAAAARAAALAKSLGRETS